MTTGGRDNLPYGISGRAVELYLQLAAGQEVTEDSAELQELIAAGLAERDDTWSHTSIPAPELTIPNMRNRQLSAVEELLREAFERLHIHAQLPYLQHAAEDSQNRARPTAGHGTITHLVDKEQINALAGRLMATATEFRGSKPGGRQSTATLVASYERDLPYLRAHPGMIWRSLYASDARADPATCEWAAAFTAAGGEVRTTTRPFARWMIFGRADALVSNPLVADDNGAIHISDPATVAALADDWDTRYLHCRPLTGPDAPGGIHLSEEQLTIIHGILEQRPRKAIATALGITDKTLARRIVGVEQALGVSGDGAIGYAYAKWEDRQLLERGGPI